MMQGLEQILGSSGLDLSSLGAKFGLSADQTQAAVGALMPAVLGGFQKRADAGTLAPVTAAGGAIDQPDTDAGNGILGHIFGGKDVSRQVADHAAGETGLTSTITQAMLPVVAAMVAKHFAANPGAQPVAQGDPQAGNDGGGIGGLIGSMMGGGGIGGALGGLLGGGNTGGANPLDAILAKFK